MKSLQRLSALLLMGATALALRAQSPQALFEPVTPCRVVDTRNANGPLGGPIMTANSTRSFPIPSACGIPANASGYSFNVTVQAGSNLGYLELWPTGRSQPLAANLVFFPGEIISNAAIVPAGDGGAVSVFVNADTHVIIDITGYFVAEVTTAGNIYIGNNVGPIDVNGNPITSETGPTIRIGDPKTNSDPTAQTFVAGIVNGVLASPSIASVFVDGSGHLGIVRGSSARYKEDIHEMGDASSAIMDLRPVEFRYKQPAPDGSKPIQYGLIAEEVAKVLPELVMYGKAGEVEGVQYDKLPALLLNEVQKQQRHIEDQEKQIESLRDQLKAMQAQMQTGAAKK